MNSLRVASHGERGAKVEFSAITIPLPILETINRLIEELGYWPSRSVFACEACLKKIERKHKRLRRLGGNKGIGEIKCSIR